MHTYQVTYFIRRLASPRLQLYKALQHHSIDSIRKHTLSIHPFYRMIKKKKNDSYTLDTNKTYLLPAPRLCHLHVVEINFKGMQNSKLSYRAILHLKINIHTIS